MNRATELVANALAPEQDYFTMDDLLGELEMSDFDSDPRVSTESKRARFNFFAFAEDDREIDDRRARGEKFDYREYERTAHGLPEAETEYCSTELAECREALMREFRGDAADGNLIVIDPRKDFDGVSRLPRWYRHDPSTANIELGIIASYPNRLYAFRGGFQFMDLAQLIYDGKIPTHCNLNVSPECDPSCRPNPDSSSQKIWGMFALSSGPHMLFFSVCAPCYSEFWHNDQSTSFDVFDPKYDMIVD